MAFMSLMPGIINAQNLRVGGTVTGERNEALVGVTVVVKGTNIGSITDADGRYALTNVPQGSTLVFTYFGYLTQEVEVTGSVVNATLQADSQMLEEVVVIGYGQQRKVTLTGAVSNVGGSELLKSPVSNLGNALAGRLPGVSSVQYSGMPGADTPTIRVRGVGSLNSADPLVLVDGVERDFMQIDPNEIADISILKDASATAVFGVRGANGVILVTTKRGQDGKASVSFSAQGGIQTITKFIETVGAYQYATAYNNAQLGDGIDPSQLRFSETAVQHFRDGDQPILYPNTNWLDYVMKPHAWQSQYNINVSGGNDRARYFVSLGALDQDGLFQTFDSDPEGNFKYRRYNYRANIDLNLSKRSQLAVNIGGRIENRNEIGEGESNLFRYLQEAVPMAGYGIDDQGRRIVSDPLLVGPIGNDGLTRFYNLGYKKRSNNVLNLDLQYKLDMGFLTEGLSFSVKGSYNSDYTAEKFRQNSHGDDGGIVKYMATNVGTLENPVVALKRQGADPTRPYREYRLGGRNWYAETSFNYARKFGKHNVGGLLLYNQSKRYYPKNFKDIPTGYVGMVGRVTYDYDTRYLIDMNLGYNGSENFAPGKRYGLFPSASLGWIPSSEKFWEPVKNIVNYMKLRVSVGMVGNDSTNDQRFLYLPGRYEFLTNSYDNNRLDWSHGHGTANFGINNENWLPGAVEASLGNPDVTWEKATKQNYGIDMAFFRSRLSVSADFFFENRRDILVDNGAALPGILGIQPSSVNYGRVKNHGWELTMKWEDRKGDFYYSIAPAVTFVRNKVVEMLEVPKEFPHMYHTGHPVGQTFGYEFFEFYNPGETERRYKEVYGYDIAANGGISTFQGVGEIKPGDAVYVDLTGDGTIDQRDEHALGYSDIPEYNASLNMSFGWKNFDLSMVWIGATNVNRWLGYSFWRPQFGSEQNSALNQWVYDNSWTPETAATARLPRLTFTNQEHNIRNSSVWMVDGSYIRLKSAELGYTLRNIPRIPQIGSIRIYLSGYNLLTFSKFTGNDPESEGGAWDVFIKYPMTRVINFGVNVNF